MCTARHTAAHSRSRVGDFCVRRRPRVASFGPKDLRVCGSTGHHVGRHVQGALSGPMLRVRGLDRRSRSVCVSLVQGASLAQDFRYKNASKKLIEKIKSTAPKNFAKKVRGAWWRPTRSGGLRTSWLTRRRRTPVPRLPRMWGLPGQYEEGEQGVHGGVDLDPCARADGDGGRRADRYDHQHA